MTFCPRLKRRRVFMQWIGADRWSIWWSLHREFIPLLHGCIDSIERLSTDRAVDTTPIAMVLERGTSATQRFSVAIAFIVRPIKAWNEVNGHSWAF